MPRAPQYNPGQIESPRVTGERLRPANDSGGWVLAAAQGLRQLGQTGADVAKAEDAIQAHYDDTQARTLALEYQREAQPILSEFASLKGQNAITAAPATRQRLEDLRTSYLGRAGNQRMADFLEQRVNPVAADLDGKIGDWSIKQQVQLDLDATVAEIDLASESAASAYLEPEVAAGYISQADEGVQRYAQLQGWSPTQANQKRLEVVSGIHDATITAMLAEDDADILGAAAYLDAHQDEMTAADRNSALAKLKGPLELRGAASRFNEVVSGLPAQPVEQGQPVGLTIQRPVAGGTTVEGGQYGAPRDGGSRRHAGVDFATAAGSSIRPAAAGVVVFSGWLSGGGNSVRIRQPDGHVVSYMHMQHPSTLREGQQVSLGTVIGTVGSTGHSSGPHLHFEVRDAKGNPVDPVAYLNGAAAPVGPPSDARNWDMASVMAGIDAKVASGEWTFEQGESTRQYARRRMADDEALLADREQDADRDASAWVVAHPTFTNINQMPESIRNRLHPDDIAKWMNVADQNKNPSTNVANGPVANVLDVMRFQEPGQFASLNLGEFVGQVTAGEMNTFLAQQAEARQGQQNWSPRSGVVTALNYQSTLDNKTYSTADKAAILKLMEDFAFQRRRDNGGKDLSDADYAEAYRYATQEVRTVTSGLGGLFRVRGTTEERYNLTDQQDLAEQRRQVIDLYRQQNNGAIPTEAQIRAGIAAMR